MIGGWTGAGQAFSGGSAQVSVVDGTVVLNASIWKEQEKIEGAELD